MELLRHNVRIWQMNLDIYCGDGAAALGRLKEPITAMERSLVNASIHVAHSLALQMALVASWRRQKR